MRIRFSSAAVAETAVTLASAALMTLAGYEMLHGVVAWPEWSTAFARPPAQASPRLPHVAMPHVDCTNA